MKSILYNRKLFITSFVLINLFFSCFYIDTRLTWDNISRGLSVIELVENTTFCIDNYHELTRAKSVINGHYYSDKPPLLSLLVAPVYFALNLSGIVKNTDTIKEKLKAVNIAGSIICGAVPFTLIVLFLFLRLNIINSAFSPFFLSMVPLYGSFLFIYSGTFYNHILSAALALIALIAINEHRIFFIAGLLIGAAFACDYLAGFIGAIWAVMILVNEKRLAPSMMFCCGCMPGVLFIAIYHSMIIGSPFQFMYQYVAHEEFQNTRNSMGFGWPDWSNFFQLLFSRYRGVVFNFTFLLILSLSCIYYCLKNKSLNTRTVVSFVSGYSFVPFLLIVLVLSSHAEWWGGDRYGPRHLATVCTLLYFDLLVCITQMKIVLNKWFMETAATIGLLASWMAKTTVGYVVPEEFIDPLADVVMPAFFNKEFSKDNILTMLMGISPDSAAIGWLVLFITGLMAISIWYQKVVKIKSQ